MKNLDEILRHFGRAAEATQELSPKDELKERLEYGIRSVMSGENFKAWLSTGGKLFYNNYSFRNAMLVWLQKPDASHVMGYEQWKQFGRTVKRGAKGAKVLIPRMQGEPSKGALFGRIKKSLIERLETDPSLSVAKYRVGMSSIEFTMNRANHAIGVKIGGKEARIFGSDEEARRFISRSVIGKVADGFMVGTVFDEKDTAVPEHLWMKSGFTKEEVVLGDDGNPIKNERGETKIINTPQRQSRFQPSLDTKIAAKDPEKMQLLFDACVAVSERKGVPVSLANAEEDPVLGGGAKGYFSREFTEEKPNGFIVIDENLEVTEKCAVLFHELGHADLHKNLEALAQKMGEEKISRQMREVQAEAVAFSVASTFGIDTDTSSFNYLAAYSKGFELQDFQKSLEVIYSESKALTADIAAELDHRGLTLDLNEKPKEPLDAETLKTLSAKFSNFAAEQGDAIRLAYKELPELIRQSEGNAALTDNLKYQKENLDLRKAETAFILGGIERLNTATDRAGQEKIVAEIDSAMQRTSGYAASFEELAKQYAADAEASIHTRDTAPTKKEGLSNEDWQEHIRSAKEKDAAERNGGAKTASRYAEPIENKENSI
ncbi:MAG: hypothetical protein IJA73_03705 [Oscillospiraceae bacterium]|nr:hypothetical protein [Oscillospiraceae bacterium]